jgi:hypothetical protein
MVRWSASDGNSTVSTRIPVLTSVCMPPKIGKSAIEVTLNVQELYDLFIHDASDKFGNEDLALP